MSMSARGDPTDAVSRFYNMTKIAMNSNSSEDDEFPFDGSLYYYKAEKEKNVMTHASDNSTSQHAIIVLLAILSIGIFSLTVAVIYLLCNRTHCRKASHEKSAAADNEDGRLGITGINYLGSNWLEVKSTSSGSSYCSDISNEPKVTLPQIVGNTASSICCSSVSELSSQTLETGRKAFSSNTDLEIIDEEARSVESMERPGEGQTTPLCNKSSATIEDNRSNEYQQSVAEISVDNDRSLSGFEDPNEEKPNESHLSSSPTTTENVSFYTSVETPPVVGFGDDDSANVFSAHKTV
jgi:hypothetical protein